MASEAPATPSAMAAATHAPAHHVYLVGSLLVTQPWIDLGEAAGSDRSGYLTIENRGGAPDRLTGASVDGAASVTVAAATPTDRDGVTIPPQSVVALEPGQAHLILHGMQGVTRDSPPLGGTLHFERAGALHVSFSTHRTDATSEDQTTPATEEKPVDLAH